VVLALLVFMDPVDADGDGDDERVVLARPDLHSVGVPDTEPLPGDPPHQSPVTGELPVLVREVAGGLKPRPVSERDLVANSFLRMSARMSPEASLSSKVSRRLSALPSTKKTRFPFSSSIQKSAVKEKTRS
jgi:hypothetical protein